MKEPLSRLQILSQISGGRLIELTPRHAYNDIWTRSKSGEYFGKGYQVVATDGSLRLNRSSTKEPAMGAGVMWHDAAIPHRSEQVGGQHSSTRAELAAVVMALRGTPRADDLAILIDSAAAIQSLRWFRSHDFRPAEHKVKKYNISIEDLNLVPIVTGGFRTFCY